MLIAQISDPHLARPGEILFGGYDPAAALAAVLARVATLEPRPDLVLLTGDLTQNGSAEEYTVLCGLLRGFDLPAAAIPGNHDNRAAFVAGLAEVGIVTGALPILNVAFDAGPLRLIGLDTLGPEGEMGGLLCDQRLAWVEAQLDDARERPTLIFMHHQPFATGIQFMDAIGCENGDRLGAIVACHSNVVGVLCGHVHRAVTAAFAGTVASACPSVAYAAPLNLGPPGPPRLLPERPAFQLHLWNEGQPLVTHTDYVSSAA